MVPIIKCWILVLLLMLIAEGIGGLGLVLDLVEMRKLMLLGWVILRVWKTMGIHVSVHWWLRNKVMLGCMEIIVPRNSSRGKV